jgi:formate-dependent nitrite reductase membrane component NrfD
MQNKFSKERIESIMTSLSGIQSAAAPDFFYTRLKGKMQPAEEKKTIFILRPAFITAALSFFLIVNVFSLLTINKTSKQPISLQYDKPATIESFAKAYDLNAESVYE